MTGLSFSYTIVTYTRKGIKMAFNQHANPRDNFGQDFIKVLGPVSARKHISEFSPAERDAILKLITQTNCCI